MATEVPNNLDFILIWPYLGISTGRAVVKWRSGCLEDAQKQMGGEEGKSRDAIPTVCDSLSANQQK